MQCNLTCADCVIQLQSWGNFDSPSGPGGTTSDATGFIAMNGKIVYNNSGKSPCEFNLILTNYPNNSASLLNEYLKLSICLCVGMTRNMNNSYKELPGNIKN